jgi:TetR/AcrR family transcriptional regulator, cholesterol catabolism regulator
LMAEKMQCQVCVMDDCISEAGDAVQEVFYGVTQMQELLSKINPVLFYDLQKYHPEAWQYYVTFRTEKLFTVINNNLKRGVEEGNYRKEINTDILTWMRIGQIDAVFGQMTYPRGQFNIAGILTEITEHFLYGICTPQGSGLIKKYKQTASND